MLTVLNWFFHWRKYNFVFIYFFLHIYFLYTILLTRKALVSQGRLIPRNAATSDSRVKLTCPLGKLVKRYTCIFGTVSYVIAHNNLILVKSLSLLRDIHFTINVNNFPNWYTTGKEKRKWFYVLLFTWWILYQWNQWAGVSFDHFIRCIKSSADFYFWWEFISAWYVNGEIKYSTVLIVIN